jgi:tetratricopeptide (TPR) repeat protein
VTAARYVLCALVVVAAALAPATAAGQRRRPAPVAMTPQEEARELYRKGMTHYEIGAFDTAIDEFKRAYELTNAPGLLFNIAQVYRMKKDPEQALYFYRTYLRLMPDAPNRTDVEVLIRENQALLDAEHRKREAAAAAAQPAPPAAAPAPATTTAPTTPAAAAPAPPPPRPRPWRLELGLGAGVAAVGLGALGAAIGLGVRASSDADQISRADAQRDVPWDATQQRIYSDGHDSALASTVLYVVGGTLVAGGAALVTLGLRDRARARTLALVPTPGGPALVTSCAF